MLDPDAGGGTSTGAGAGAGSSTAPPAVERRAVGGAIAADAPDAVFTAALVEEVAGVLDENPAAIDVYVDDQHARVKTSACVCCLAVNCAYLRCVTGLRQPRELDRPGYGFNEDALAVWRPATPVRPSPLATATVRTHNVGHVDHRQSFAAYSAAGA